jgi:DNA polymerase I
MELNINLQLTDNSERVKEVEKKMKAKQYQPTMKELWFTGYKTHTGTQKKGIYQTKVTDADRVKLDAVYQAVTEGEIPVGVTDMKKFTKAHALRLYKVLLEQRKSSTIKKLVSEIPDNYLLINTFESFRDLLSDLRKEEEFAVDTETTGLDYIGTVEKEADIIVGISFTLPKADYHVYIPINHTEGKQLPADYVLDRLKPILENPVQKKILFNAKFDAHMFLRHGIRLANIYFDGFVAMKLLSDFEESYSLKNLSTKYGSHFGFNDKSATYEELFGKGGFEDTPFETSDGGRGIGTLYACKDTHLTYKFYRDFLMVHFNRLPKIKDLYFKIENPILEICVEMEQAGMLIDLEYSNRYAKQLEAEITVLESVIKRHLGDININSPAQLSEVLYDVLGLPDVSGKRSTDAKTLQKLSGKNEGVEVLLKYRDLNKLYSTYISPLPTLVDRNTRLHSQFLQVQTATGRFASRGPNFQNLPSEARKMFIPAKGHLILGGDYSQIEPRVLAHFTEDESMINAYRSGRDLYVEMAMKVFGLEEKYCIDKAKSPDGSFEPRKAVKSVLLGIMYGMGSKTLSQNLKMSEEQAKKIIADFFKAYPKIDGWIADRIRFAEENEYIETMFGRKRRFIGFKTTAKRYHAVCKKVMDQLGHLPDFIWDDEYRYSLPYDIKREYWDMGKAYAIVKRRVINTIIQGSSADIMKLAMIEVAKLCREKGWNMLATIHDEILLEVPVGISLEEVELIEKKMLGVINLKTPMKVDVAFMPNRWGEEVSKDKWFKAS